MVRTNQDYREQLTSFSGGNQIIGNIKPQISEVNPKIAMRSFLFAISIRNLGYDTDYHPNGYEG